MKILVVDDEKVLVKGIKFNLESEGYQVEAGYDGEEAVELARSGSFDLIILDLMMPKIDGLQACMRIREFSNVPIIMLTARSEDTDKIIGFECGADDYITKPFNILELKARVRALLRRAALTVRSMWAFRMSRAVRRSSRSTPKRSRWPRMSLSGSLHSAPQALQAQTLRTLSTKRLCWLHAATARPLPWRISRKLP